MARQSLLPLIDRLRMLVHDNGDAGTVFSDDELEGFLDDNRTDAIEYPLTVIPERVDGATVYRIYTAVPTYWEQDAALVDANGTTVTPSTSAPLVGRWEFSGGQAPPVYITGKFFDINAAAADVLEAWAAGEALSFDFEADGASYKRSQKAATLLRLAAQYRKKARPYTAQMRV